jgi:hypothetical protein
MISANPTGPAHSPHSADSLALAHLLAAERAAGATDRQPATADDWVG